MSSSPLINAEVQAFVTFQNTSRYSNRTTNGPVYPDQAGFVSATANNVVAFVGGDNINLGTGYSAVVMDGPRSQYDIQVDGTDTAQILDTVTGQTMAVQGASYFVFNAGQGVAAETTYLIETAAKTQIALLYAGGLARQPDLMGLEYWIAQQAAGQTLEQIANGFIGSTEFTTHYGAVGSLTDAQYVTTLYQNLLNRAPDASGLAYWENQLANGQSRADVLLGFTYSVENVRNVSVGGTGANGWLIDTSLGGYADAATPLPTATVLQQGIADGYIDLATVSNTGQVTVGPSINQSIVANPNFNINGQTDLITVSGYTGLNIVLSSSPTTGFNRIYDNDNNDNIYSGPTGGDTLAIGGSGVTPGLGTGQHVYLSGTGNIVVSSGIGNPMVYGWAKGDLIAVGTPAPGPTTIYQPFASSPLHGSDVNFGYGPTNIVVDVGNVGTGTVAEVVAAANKVYDVSDVAKEWITFMGQTNAGNTVLDYWGPGTGQQIAAFSTADTNGNHQVDVSEITGTVTLIGVQTLEATDFWNIISNAATGAHAHH